jgi:hypothetical protein
LFCQLLSAFRKLLQHSNSSGSDKKTNLDCEKMTETNTGLDSAYVKEQLGDVLTVLLSELVQVQPSDPIEWLANALRQHARGQSVSIL